MKILITAFEAYNLRTKNASLDIMTRLKKRLVMITMTTSDYLSQNTPLKS